MSNVCLGTGACLGKLNLVFQKEIIATRSRFRTDEKWSLGIKRAVLTGFDDVVERIHRPDCHLPRAALRKRVLLIKRASYVCPAWACLGGKCLVSILYEIVP